MIVCRYKTSVTHEHIDAQAACCSGDSDSIVSTLYRLRYKAITFLTPYFITYINPYCSEIGPAPAMSQFVYIRQLELEVGTEHY